MAHPDLRVVPDHAPEAPANARDAAFEALDERGTGVGGLDRPDDIADVRARHDYLLGYLVELHVQARLERYGARPSPAERRRIGDEVRAELWDQSTTPEGCDVTVDRRREVGRR